MQSSVLSTGGGNALINPADTVILLIDHQTGPFLDSKSLSRQADLRLFRMIDLARTNLWRQRTIPMALTAYCQGANQPDPRPQSFGGWDQVANSDFQSKHTR